MNYLMNFFINKVFLKVIKLVKNSKFVFIYKIIALYGHFVTISKSYYMRFISKILNLNFAYNRTINLCKKKYIKI